MFKKTSKEDFQIQENPYTNIIYVEKDVVCRILPAINEKPYHKWVLVWIPCEDGKIKCFATESNLGQKCPISSLQEKISKIIKNPTLLNEIQNNEEVIAKIKNIAFKLNLQTFYLYNIVFINNKNEQQQGILHLKTTAHKQLIQIINDCLDAGFDPLDIKSGIWFKFSRVVEANKTNYTTNQYMVFSKDEKGRITQKLFDEELKFSEEELYKKCSKLEEFYKITNNEEIKKLAMQYISKTIDINLFKKIMEIADKN